MAWTSGADVSTPAFEPQDDMLNIIIVTKISQNVSIKFIFIAKGEHLFQIIAFPDICVPVYENVP